MTREELSQETIKYINETDLEHRKKFGQYFTPKSLRETLLNKLPKLKNAKILDPASGSGEFLVTARKYFPDSEIYGWEIDPNLVVISKTSAPSAKVECVDSLSKESKEVYDFIIGNPPYFEFTPNREIKKEYQEILIGRVNAYALFIYKSIKLLKRGGYLAFVVPPSMNNGAYFSKLRNFIIHNCNIEFLSVQRTSALFEGALQSVMLLILKKSPNNGNYIFRKNGITIFSEDAPKLKEIFKNSTTLGDLGFRVQTGTLVWNQNKEILTDIPSGAVPLIWSHNITREGLKFEKRASKPQYVKARHYSEGPAIVTNRIVGQPGKGSLRAAIVPEKLKFLAENHVNVIYPPAQSRLFGSRLKGTLDDLTKQLNSPVNAQILCRLTGNTQISKNELEKLFPIKLSKA